MATPVEQVSAFCRAILRKLLPGEVFDKGGYSSDNWRIFLRHTDGFLRLRRFENLTLEDVMKQIKVTSIPWMRPAKLPKDAPTSRTDHEKRVELLAELTDWVFSSILIPLVRTNFYVTESAGHRNRLLYFRQDVWQGMVQPAKTELKDKMLEKLKAKQALRILGSRSLPHSQLRFVPKDSGMRPIANLKRRMPITRNGMRLLTKSANSTLMPTFTAMNFEKVGCSRSQLLGLSLKLNSLKGHTSLALR